MNKLIASGALCAFALAAAGNQLTDTVWRDQKVRIANNANINKAKVAADMQAAGVTGSAVWYAVPAMSDVMRLSDSYPADGRLAGEVRATLAGNESESASFQLFSFADAAKADIRMSDLVCDGEKLEADIRVVKLWFQNGNAWVSYFDDSGLKLVPELLLHDENLIKVDLDKGENLARIVKDGKETFHWISAPKPLAARDTHGFDQFDPGFADAETMQPVKLVRNEFKQFFITARAKKGQKGGVYRGKVTVSVAGKALCDIPLAFRVLDFELPLPGTYADPSSQYIYDCMGASANWGRCLSIAEGDEAKAKELFRRWMQSLYDHGLFNAINIDKDTPEWQLDLFREIGFPFDGANGHVWTGWFALNFGGRMTYAQHKTAWRVAKEADELYHKKLGMKDVRLAYGDEQGAGFIAAHRDLWDAYLFYGFGGLGFCGHDALPYKGGYNTSFYGTACNPDDEAAVRVRQNCGGRQIGFYACQHTGSENPQFTRRQHGMLSYLSGMNMTYNYEFAIGSFNDRADLVYRPMVVSYANAQGIMETIEYAGFREGCDDIRYATAALMLADEGLASDSMEAKRLGGRIRHYLATLDKSSFDLNEARAELIEFIVQLRKELRK